MLLGVNHRVNDTFGSLTIKEFLGYDRHRKNKMVRCVCSCGRESITQLAKLLSGHSKTCGQCNRVDPGDIIGKWSIIAEAGRDRCGGRLLLCRCTCGREAKIRATQLGTGRSKGCGRCNRLERGDRCGSLEVIGEAGKDSANRRRLRCQCDCGRIAVVDAYNLRSGTTKTCGRCNSNEFRTDGLRSYGSLRDGHEFVFDTAYLAIVKQYQWHLATDGYVKTTGESGKGTGILSRILMNPTDNEVVDHIDGDPLNNCVVNLRRCTRQQNVFNQKLGRANRTGFTGVFRLSSGLFRVSIGFNRRTVSLGRYRDLDEAAMVRNEAAKLLFGEFARLNGSSDAPVRIKKYVFDRCRDHLTDRHGVEEEQHAYSGAWRDTSFPSIPSLSEQTGLNDGYPHIGQ